MKKLSDFIQMLSLLELQFLHVLLQGKKNELFPLAEKQHSKINSN